MDMTFEDFDEWNIEVGRVEMGTKYGMIGYMRLRLDQELMDDIREEAERLGFTISEIARLAFRNYIVQVRHIREKGKGVLK